MAKHNKKPAASISGSGSVIAQPASITGSGVVNSPIIAEMEAHITSDAKVRRGPARREKKKKPISAAAIRALKDAVAHLGQIEVATAAHVTVKTPRNLRGGGIATKSKADDVEDFARAYAPRFFID